MQRRLSAHYAYIYAHFSLFDVFTVAWQAPGRAWNWVVQFCQGGARLWRSPPQHLPVWFARSKLRLVGEVSPFDSEFTTRGLLTQMWSGTPSKSAEGDFFKGLLFTFWKTRVWGWWNVYIASWRLFQIVHIYMHKAVKGLSNKSFDNFLLCAKTCRSSFT